LKPEFYIEQWGKQQEAPDAESLGSLAERIAANFIDRYFYNDEYERQYIDLLCEMATFFDDPKLNQLAASAFFGTVVERLCDDFEELQTETYNRLISQVIANIRRQPKGSELDKQLSNMGLHTEEEIYQRVENNRVKLDEKLPDSFNPQKIIVLSRVTIGADIAVTSVICQRAAKVFPEARVIIVGSGKLGEVMSHTPNTEIRELQYSRRGGLIEKFNAWLNLLDVIRKEVSDLNEEQYLVLDPDSRLSQLGVLPVVGAASYRFFNSRGKPSYPARASISELTNVWLNAIFGEDEFFYPKIWPSNSNIERAKSFISELRASGAGEIVCINLGVGGNFRKRLTGDFEISLVLKLLEQAQVKVLLDLGFGVDERQQTSAILEAVAASGLQVASSAFADLDATDVKARLIGIECSIGQIAALISQSDEFIGYDSACQHIAAAQGVRACTVFAGSNNVRFIRRWRACGPNLSELVFVDTLSKDREVNTSEVVARILGALRPA
jgi:ADP-heptose:LPS heptosyltransferase